MLRPWLAGLLLVVGCLYIYHAIPGTDFVMFDDDVNFVYNEKLGPLNWERFRWIATEHSVMVRYVPVGWLFCCALTGINGLDPFWFHSASVALHAGSCVLLYILLRRLSPRFGIQTSNTHAPVLTDLLPFCIAAWWGWHPLRVETVAWATPLIYVLATFLGLLSMLLFVESTYAEGSGRPYLRARVGAVILCLMALLAHPSALGFVPIIMVLFMVLMPPKTGLRHCWKDRAWQWVTFKRMAPFVAVGVATLAATMAVRQMQSLIPRAGTPSLADFGLLPRFAQACASIVHFIEKTLWPGKLNPVYPFLYDVDPSAPLFVLSMIASCGLVIVLIFTLQTSRRAGLIALAALAACIPVLGLNEHPSFPCDRYTHIPSISLAIFLLAASGLGGFSKKLTVRAGIPLLVALLPIWLIVSQRQTQLWSSTERLYSEIAEIQTSPAVRTHFLCRNVAEHMDRGELELARQALARLHAEVPMDANIRAISDHFTQVERDKGPAAYAILLNSQARLALKQGENELAIERLRRALAYAPDWTEARFNLGLLLAIRGETQEALAHLLWLRRLKTDELRQRTAVLKTVLAEAFRASGDEHSAKLVEALSEVG